MLKNILNNTSFNPCSVGFSFWTLTDADRCYPNTLCFNPCSVGFSFWTSSLLQCQQSDSLCVSILVLLDFPFGLSQLLNIDASTNKFQSLFCWIFLLDSTVPNGMICCQVSILVLLDFPFGHSSCRRKSLGLTVFQSLFCWIFLLDLSSMFASAMLTDCFNPCSVGFSFWTLLITALTAITIVQVSILVLLDFPFGRD